MTSRRAAYLGVHLNRQLKQLKAINSWDRWRSSTSRLEAAERRLEFPYKPPRTLLRRWTAVLFKKKLKLALKKRSMIGWFRTWIAIDEDCSLFRITRSPLVSPNTILSMLLLVLLSSARVFLKSRLFKAVRSRSVKRTRSWPIQSRSTSPMLRIPKSHPWLSTPSRTSS